MRELGWFSLEKGYHSYRKGGNNRTDPSSSQLCPGSGSEGMGTQEKIRKHFSFMRLPA